MFKKARKVKNVRNKFTTAYIVSIVCAMVVTTILLIGLFNGKIRKDIYVEEIKRTRVFVECIKLKLEEMNRVSSFVIEDLDIRDELKKEDEINRDKIETILNKFLVNNRDVDAICIIDKQGKAYIKQSAPLTYNDDKIFLEKVPYEEIKESKGSTYLYIDRKHFDNDSKENTIVLGREILSEYDFEAIGTVVIYVKSTALNNIYSNINEYIDSDYILSDKNNNIIYFTKGKDIITYEENVDIKNGTYNKVSINGEDRLAAVDKLNILSGKVLSISNESNMSDYILIAIVVLIVMNIVFLLLYNIFVDKSILDPLDAITDAAKSINTKKDLSKRFKIKNSYSEVESIIEALNNMMQRVQDLIVEVEREQKIQNKLELDRLNSQIKPHFLYNTLNIASSLILIGKENDANELIYTLARYYRESLSGGEEIITLGEEISITYDYISIIKLAQTIDFTIDYEIDNDLINYEIPKLTIQPLIENCIKYGIKNDESTLKIQIKIKAIENREGCIITISDNGCGIDKETLNKIYSREKIGRTNGFGLRSIIDRISLYYNINDKEELVEITSKKLEGTTINIVLPKEKCEK